MTAYSVGDSNLFAYCGNNPVMRGDAEGELWHVVAGAVVGGLISGITTAFQCAQEGQSVKQIIAQTLVATACGAIGGGLAATGIGVFGQTIAGAMLGGIQEIASQKITNPSSSIDFVEVNKRMIAGAVGGLL